jgi:DNA-directed RNA polymerase subunit RPC12/RpoP
VKTYVCSKCGAENSISRLYEIEAWEGVEVSDKDGVPHAEKTGEREADWSMAYPTNYHCAECEQQKADLVDAVVARGEAECRDCGFSGAPNEHPASCSGELIGQEPPEIHPAQVALEVPA